MRLSGECANFEFETGQVSILANVTYPFVVSNTVNMRTVLGDMYDKYNKFYIVFNSLGGFSGNANLSYTTSGATSQNALVWTLGMSGDLRFLSNTVNGQLSTIGYFPMRFTLPVNGYNFLNGAITNGIVFEKPSNDIGTINISPYLIRGGAPANLVCTANTTYDFNFSFTIYGLSE
jgi:hypothetical protein